MTNIPTLRSTIVAETGYTFISLDASQIELRVLALLSQDPQLLADLTTGDLHLATAIRMFGESDDPEVMSKRRYDAKQANFACIYGADEFKLAEMFNCSVEEAQVFMEDHRVAYPRLYEWVEEKKAEARENGFVINQFGRIRPLPELYAGSWKMREKAEREVVNTIVQGQAVDIVKLMGLYLRDILDKRVRFLLQVHDEWLLEAPDELLSVSLEQCKELSLAFPSYPVTISVGKRYSELQRVENG